MRAELVKPQSMGATLAELDAFGPRRPLDVGACAGVAAAIVALIYLVRHRHLRLRLDNWRARFTSERRDLMGASNPLASAARGTPSRAAS